jgi:segregation and condensation protein B
MQELEQSNDAPVDAPETNRAEQAETAVPDDEVGAMHASPDAGPTAPEDDFDDVLIAEAVTELPPDEDPQTALKAIIEAAIYITDEPLTPEQIAGAVEQPVAVVKQILAQLADEYVQPSRGLTIRELAGGYKMGTKPEHHESIRKFVKKLQAPLKLSLAALETLAVVAYKQPITAPEIMEIRGVQGAGVLKTLLDRKLVATAGRKDVIGKPILYKTTKEFLVQFGLSTLNELPTLKEFEELGRLSLTDEMPTNVQESSNSAAEAEAAHDSSSPERRDDSQAEPVAERPPSGQSVESSNTDETSLELGVAAGHAGPDAAIIKAEESENDSEQTEPNA